MKKILLSAVFACCFQAQAQTFQSKVKIEYERVIYVHKQMQEMEPEWFDRIKNNMPVTAVNYYDFVGDTTQSLYKESKPTILPSTTWYRPEANLNVVYNNYVTGQTVTQKPVEEETFLISDSLSKIKWRITADTRNIAGYECRKAIGILDDSVALFAFYTDEILVRGGPESIQGLPGMILGVGIPRLHASWFATKVEVNGVNMTAVKPSTKGKKSSRQAMMAELDNAVKNWGRWGTSIRNKYII